MNKTNCDINISYHHNNGEEKVRKLHKFSNAVGYEAFLYPSFGAPLVLLWSPYGDSEDARYIHGGSSELSRRCHGVLTEVYASGNIGGVANEAGFNGSRTCVHGRMNLCCGKGIVVASKTKEL